MPRRFKQLACVLKSYLVRAISDYMEALAASVRGDAVVQERDRLLGEKSRLMRRAQLLRRDIVTAQENDHEADTVGFRVDLAVANASLTEITVRLVTLPTPQKAAGKFTATLSRLPEALASPVMTISEKRWLLDAVVLRVEPVEGGKGPRNKVDGSCVVTLRGEDLRHLPDYVG